MVRRDNSTLPAAMRIALEAPQVIALRLAKIGQGGPAARTETRMMISEKVAAAAKAQMMFLRGVATGKPQKGANAAVKLFSSKVSANRRRLSKG